MSVSFRSRHADSPGPPGRVYLPPVTPVQWLQAQELPVIQAKGLELEHFHPWVSTARTHGEGLREVEDWPLRPPGAVPATAPRSHGPALPRGLHSARLRYKEQRAQKPAAFSLSLALSRSLARTGSQCCCLWWLVLLGASLGVPRANRSSSVCAEPRGSPGHHPGWERGAWVLGLLVAAPQVCFSKRALGSPWPSQHLPKKASTSLPGLRG